MLNNDFPMYGIKDHFRQFGVNIFCLFLLTIYISLSTCIRKMLLMAAIFLKLLLKYIYISKEILFVLL